MKRGEGVAAAPRTDYARGVQVLTPFISVVVIGAYLAAAFLDCEPVAKFYGAIPSVAESIDVHHGQVAAASSADPHAGHHTNHHDAQSATHGRDAVAVVSHAGHHASHDPDEHAGQHASHDASGTRQASTPARAPQEFQDLRGEGLTFAPTCLCGCSETRSTVGGNASRLGSVAPGVHIAWRAEAEALQHVFSPPSLLVGITLGLDPIPI